MSRPLTAVQSNAVYNVLVQYAGAVKEAREGFVRLQTNGHLPEYRFIGALGFGGKFWRNAGAWYVTAYPEDIARDPSIQARIDTTNTALAALDKQGVNA